MKETTPMMKKCDGGSKKLERKTIEKNRRTHMKRLCDELTSLVPSLFSQSSKDSIFDQSIAYIEQLQKIVERSTEKRIEASRLVNKRDRDNTDYDVRDDQPAVTCDGVRLPTVEVKEFDDGLQVRLTSRSKRNFTFSDVVRIVEDGGGEVVNGGYTTLGEKVFYTLHAKARIPRIGVETTCIYERLQELINEARKD
ncbi:uncharacterized protein LOC112511742 isoform X2 [Cynara cardunculus var. scolymus]|nr:uncharacterized protein LOC112511742 isoform X2 [Cynara cardunculus var. scolymus]